MIRSPALALSALALATAHCSHAQTSEPVQLERVVLSSSGALQRVIDTPYAVSVVDEQELRSAGPLVNLSEAMARVPGLVVNLRNNYAQDLQISSRGFGARASFGVRGLRLYTDGIPASGPDGQGQVSHFDLAGAQRVEVLRGPFSALYGNNSGGAILLYSAAPSERRIGIDLDAGSAGFRQQRISLEMPSGPDGHGFNLRAAFAHMDSDGFRPQSAAKRDLANLRLGWDGSSDRVVLIFNSLDQPAQDPLGLTRAQLNADASQTAMIALPQQQPGQPDRFNTRKNTGQQQAGFAWTHRFDDGDSALAESQLHAYAGTRSVTQWQSIPVATQSNPLSPGGVIDFDRAYEGLDARLLWRWALANEMQARLVTGVATDIVREDRRGDENFSGPAATRILGVTGQLRRDEVNRLDSRDAYVQGEIDIAPQWSASAGLRGGKLHFRSQDRYITSTNPDDSGGVALAYRNPVAALQWRPSPTLNVYASVGRGFEAPALTELAYRLDGQSGPNTGLRPQTSRQWELGAKWRWAPLKLALDAAIFQADTRDEIGVASNVGGRSTYQNVGRTRRQGAEAMLSLSLAPQWRAQMAATWLDARYRDPFAICSAAPCSVANLAVPAGNRIAGTLSKYAYAELAWTPLAAWDFALEGRAQGRLPVDDVNSDFASGFGVFSLRAQWRLDLGAAGWLESLLRLNNLSNRNVVGSVIVNEGNGRFFEPAQGRNWMLGLRWSHRW